MRGFPGGSVVKNPTVNAGDAGDVGSISGSGRCPREEHGNPLEYSCLENPMDRGAWQVTVHGVAKNRTQLGEYHFTSLPFSLSPSKGLPKGWGREDLLITVLIVTQCLKTAKQPSL